MSELLPAFGNGLSTILVYIVALSIIVVIHEYGHYIVGRWCGIHAEVFSLGFGKVLLSRVDKRGTRWQLAAIPLGGYVKFLGDANAASFGGTAGGRNTMLGAPVWARSATVIAGPLFNFILTIIIGTFVAMWVGIAADPMVLKTVPALPDRYENQLEVGDQILSIEGVEVHNRGDVADALDQFPLQPSLNYAVLRGGRELAVTGPYPEPTLAQSVNFDSAAEDAGLEDGDVIMAIDGQEVIAFSQMVQIVGASEGKPLALDVWRAGETLQFEMTPRRTDLPKDDGTFETRWLIGLSGGIYIDPETVTPSFGDAVGNSVGQLGYITKVTFNAIKAMAVGQISTCNLSSPVGIAQTAKAVAEKGVVDFIALIGYLSAAIGLLNLLPIPVLDGGHLVFFAYEGVTRRKPSDAAVRILMALGLAIILTMTLFGVLNDTVLCP